MNAVINWITENWIIILFFIAAPIIAMGNRIIGKR